MTRRCGGALRCLFYLKGREGHAGSVLEHRVCMGGARRLQGLYRVRVQEGYAAVYARACGGQMAYGVRVGVYRGTKGCTACLHEVNLKKM